MLEINSTYGLIGLLHFRRFNDWHGKEFVAESSIEKCLNSRCPHEIHRDYSDIIDPEPLSEMKLIPSGSRVLVLMEYYDFHISYLTFDSVNVSSDCTIVSFFENSRNANYFSPSENQNSRFCIFMHFLRYVAILKDDYPAFGRYGGVACFMRELSLISGIPLGKLLREIKNYNISRQGKI